jgi:hypothetical protein
VDACRTKGSSSDFLCLLALHANSLQCMEKGLKNLTQAFRSAQKKQNDGTYHDHEDSGIGISDLDEESSPADMLSSVPEAHYSAYTNVYPTQQQQQQQRVSSIQSLMNPAYHHPSQYMAHPQVHGHPLSHPQ